MKKLIVGFLCMFIMAVSSEAMGKLVVAGIVTSRIYRFSENEKKKQTIGDYKKNATLHSRNIKNS